MLLEAECHFAQLFLFGHQVGRNGLVFKQGKVVFEYLGDVFDV